MLSLIENWLYDNSVAIFISGIVSLLISKYYFDKANRDGVLTTIIFPIVKILKRHSYNVKNYEELFSITSSYSVKYLHKEERNKLLALVSSYKTVCRYSEDSANADCVMSYYEAKIKGLGINTRPCAQKDDDGIILFYDFPPDYHYLEQYVYEVISSYEFCESPESCSKDIAAAFSHYTKKYYTTKAVHFFDDYSIKEVIKLSNVSQKWKDRFSLADKCKSDFLELPICKKAQEIIKTINTSE